MSSAKVNRARNLLFNSVILSDMCGNYFNFQDHKLTSPKNLTTTTTTGTWQEATFVWKLMATPCITISNVIGSKVMKYGKKIKLLHVQVR